MRSLNAFNTPPNSHPLESLIIKLRLKHASSISHTRSLYTQKLRQDLAVQGSTQTQSESLELSSTEQERKDYNNITTDNTAYATQAFKAAFEKAYRVQDSQACLDLVKSLMVALNKPQASKPDQSLMSCTELQSITGTSYVEKDGGRTGQLPPAVQDFSRESQSYLGKVLRGKHQGLMRLLLAAGNVNGALEYLVMLPPSLTLCSALMKECAEAGNLASLQRIIQARQFSMDRQLHVVDSLFSIPHLMLGGVRQVREALGFDQDAYCFTARIAAAGKAVDHKAVRQALKDACRQNDCTVAVYNAAIEALSRCGDVEVWSLLHALVDVC